MPKDVRVDAYIAGKPDFARPILESLRQAVHAACPTAEETIKWGMPAFTYKGAPLAQMAAFKAHATFGFWRGGLVVAEGRAQRDAMGQFGRLRSVEDLPASDVLAALVQKAMALTDAGVKAQRKNAPETPPVVPDDLRQALADDPQASATFDAFPPGCQREYADWVMGAKRAETRARRIAQAIEWMAEGKRRNWKYENC